MQPNIANINKPTQDSSKGLTKVRHAHTQFTSEFKSQVIGVYKSGVYDSVAACATAYGISDKTLYNWLKQNNTKDKPSLALDQQAEINKLKKELSRAQMENEILKKAAIYFANQAQ